LLPSAILLRKKEVDAVLQDIIDTVQVILSILVG
jgi:hypothetical protein